MMYLNIYKHLKEPFICKFCLSSTHISHVFLNTLHSYKRTVTFCNYIRIKLKLLQMF